MILSRSEVAVLRLALETQQRVMIERGRPAAVVAAQRLRDKLDVEDPVLDVEDGDWFDRCAETEDGERCGFPSLDSAAWYLHPEHHEGLRRIWGSREVAARKEQRRQEVDRG
jgi:hypothetical protein